MAAERASPFWTSTAWTLVILPFATATSTWAGP
jgi:hypothetical protein